MREPGAPNLSRNLLLEALPDPLRQRLARSFKVLSVSQGEVLYKPGESIRYAYFPLDALIALSGFTPEGRNVVVTLIGNEGLLGVRAALGDRTYWHGAVVEIPGTCLRMDAAVLRAEFLRCGPLHDRVLDYIRYLLVQISQSALCNRIHLVRPRLARWLLMVHDRVQVEEYSMTHDQLSDMLGAPRVHITLAAQSLRRSGLIDYVRGRLRFIDRAGLESAACECYRITSRELRGLWLKPRVRRPA